MIGKQLSREYRNLQEVEVEDPNPMVEKLRSQLGVIHPLPIPIPIPRNRNVVGLLGLFFLVGVAFDKLWSSRTSFSLFLEKDLQRKESVEWVNMVLAKLWKVYRAGLENWLTGLLQPVIDNLQKPAYVERVEIRQFSLGDEPLSVRNVERRTSRRANDLQSVLLLPPYSFPPFSFFLHSSSLNLLFHSIHSFI